MGPKCGKCGKCGRWVWCVEMCLLELIPTHYRNCVCTARNAVFLDSLSRANIVAKRFVFAPQQWRFSQLDDVIDTGHGEKRSSPHQHTHSHSRGRRAGWLAGWPARPDPCLPGATTAGGGGTGPRDAASSARCAALLCGTRPQAARAGSPALLQARRRARREGRPRVDANPCCARLCAPCQVGTEPGAG